MSVVIRMGIFGCNAVHVHLSDAEFGMEYAAKCSGTEKALIKCLLNHKQQPIFFRAVFGLFIMSEALRLARQSQCGNIDDARKKRLFENAFAQHAERRPTRVSGAQFP